MGASGRAGRWALARVSGVQMGMQGVLALGLGTGARAAGGRGAQALGRAGRAGVRGHADGRCRQLGEQARERGRKSARASGSRRDEQMSERAGARWLRCDATALRCDTAGGLGHDTAKPPTTKPRARSLCAQAGPTGPGWGFVHSDSVFGPVRLGSFLSHQMNNVHCKINFQRKKIFIKFN